MPARDCPPTLTAVSSAPQSLPLAYMTCCMRESLELSWPLGGPKVALLWVPMPATVVLQVGKMTVSAMHWPSGRLPAGWFARGGTAYWSTAIVDTETPTDGDELLSDDVLLIVH